MALFKWSIIYIIAIDYFLLVNYKYESVTKEPVEWSLIKIHIKTKDPREKQKSDNCNHLNSVTVNFKKYSNLIQSKKKIRKTLENSNILFIWDRGKKSDFFMIMTCM